MTHTTTPDDLLAPLVPDVFAQRLVELGVPHGWIDDVLRHAAGLTEPRREHLRACAAVLDGLAGGTAGMPEYPSGPAAGLDFVVLFAALLPRLRRLEALRRVDPLITAATVADLGRHLAVHRGRHGKLGFDEQQWFGLHITGQLHQVGRLQFQRLTAGTAAAKVGAAGGKITPEDVVLSVHIPRFLGPMSPAACDVSIAQAHAFFARHFPDEKITAAVCWSWLLDPQLGERLPHSNIAAFQRRFTPMGSPRVDDRAPLNFGFVRPDLPLDEQPRSTSLERTVLDVLQDGGHWHIGAGWFPW